MEIHVWTKFQNIGMSRVILFLLQLLQGIINWGFSIIQICLSKKNLSLLVQQADSTFIVCLFELPKDKFARLDGWVYALEKIGLHGGRYEGRQLILDVSFQNHANEL